MSPKKERETIIGNRENQIGVVLKKAVKARGYNAAETKAKKKHRRSFEQEDESKKKVLSM
jgi:hypothetical protein